MKKIRPIKNASYDWLVNYIPEPIRISAGGSKEKGISLLNRNNLNTQCVGEERNSETKNTKQN